MINILRPIDEPPDLAHQRGLAVGNCSTELIRVAIANIFHNKCYLCEKDTAPLVIEHLESHRENRDIKFRWNNLFYSCPTCNSIKSTTYDNILNCCDFNLIITDTIDFDINDSDLDNFIVTISSGNGVREIQSTIELLNLCYSGTTFETKNVAFETKKYLIEELNTLKVLIWEYFHNTRQGIPAKAAQKMSDVQAELDLLRPFLAFKISYIKKSPILLRTFGHLLPQFALVH